jgi:hypothetical protein
MMVESPTTTHELSVGKLDAWFGIGLGLETVEWSGLWN